MNVQIRFHLLSPPVPMQLMHRLISLHPEGDRSSEQPPGDRGVPMWWSFDAPLDHEVTRAVISALRDAGWVSGPEHRPEAVGGRFVLWLGRKHSPRDYRGASLLMLEGYRHIENVRWRLDNVGGLQVVGRSLARRRSDTAFCHHPAVLVSTRVRRVIESEGLADVEFGAVVPIASMRRPVVLSWREVCEPWWELRSRVRMPPFSPTVQRLDSKGRPFTNYSTQLFRPKDGPYNDFIPHYRASDLKTIAPFDLAMTEEHIPQPPLGERLIVSQRVYQLFQKHKIKARWTPVIVEES